MIDRPVEIQYTPASATTNKPVSLMINLSQISYRRVVVVGHDSATLIADVDLERSVTIVK